MRRNRILLVWVALITLGVLLAASWLCSEPETLYEIRFLPALGGSRSIIPHSINDHGHVVGVAEMSPNQWNTFIWDEDGGITDLGPYAGTRHHHDYVRINNVGQIASTTMDPNGNPSVFLLDPNGVKHILRAPNRERIHVQALNNRGQVVGYYNAERSPRMAFIWDKTTGMQDLGPPNTIESLARDLNDSGQVVGFLSTMRDSQWYAFRWDPNTGMQNLGVTRSGMIHSCRINNQGGEVARFGPSAAHAPVSMWARDGAGPSAPWFRGTFARVVGLNDANHFIVCMHLSELRIRQLAVRPHRASFFCDPNGGFKDIGNCLGRKDVVAFWARGINNRGQIIGLLSLEKQPKYLGVILEPIH